MVAKVSNRERSVRRDNSRDGKTFRSQQTARCRPLPIPDEFVDRLAKPIPFVPHPDFASPGSEYQALEVERPVRPFLRGVIQTLLSGRDGTDGRSCSSHLPGQPSVA